LIAPGALLAQPEGHAALLSFFGGQGCTIGPDSTIAASEAGFQADQVAALRDWAVGKGQGSVHRITVPREWAVDEGVDSTEREWVVLDADICDIRFPDLSPEATFNDPDMRESITWITEEDVAEDPYNYRTEHDVGCALFDTYRRLVLRPGWDLDRANEAYHELIAYHIIEGDLRVYSNDRMRTPASLRVMIGECGTVPVAREAAGSHAFLQEVFGAFVRFTFENVPCDDPGSVSPDAFQDSLGERNKNAFLFYELQFIAQGAGWFESPDGLSRNHRVPPMCHSPAP